ncbi:MAG: methyltransferase domain-containing protein [Bacillota bacterium]|nr:methyltransferase domain-containing protein [Bacillota bacterium]
MATPDDDQLERVRSFFGAHAGYYAASASHRSGSDLALLLDALRPAAEDRALDVATASGNVAFALALRVREVVGLDVTPEMGELFRRRLEAEPRENVRFALGDVHALPFPDGSFTVVASRRAAHHFRDLPLALREMRRVLAPGGRLGVADMTVPDEPRAAELMNQLEILRDASHVAARSAAEWRRLLEEAGFVVTFLDAWEELLPVADWFAPSRALADPERFARSLAEALLPGVREALFVPDGDRILWRKRRLVAVGEVPLSRER